MLRRKAYEKLFIWKTQPKKKALCIIGARQIGKTTLVRAFAREHYAHFVELNFLTDPNAARIFSGALDADTIITNLTAYTRKPMVPGETLVLLDEIQACPEARTAIKFLVEDGRFDYVETGSLLGVRYKEVRSYPVGFEELLRMYPMDLEEFLWACGVQQATMDYLRQCFDSGSPVSEAIHQTLLKLFYAYMVVGGMPDVVQTYVDTNDIARVIDRQRDILELYRLDIGSGGAGDVLRAVSQTFMRPSSTLLSKKERICATSTIASKMAILLSNRRKVCSFVSGSTVFFSERKTRLRSTAPPLTISTWDLSMRSGRSTVFPQTLHRFSLSPTCAPHSLQ